MLGRKMFDASEVKLAHTVHEKTVGGTKLALGRFVAGGQNCYGVSRDGVLEFLGTKREARDCYGTWRRSLRGED